MARDFGAVFRGSSTDVHVWAPNATSVEVVGDFNGWGSAGPAVSLPAVGNGFHSARVPGLVAGGRYELRIGRQGTPTPNTRLDPAARDTEHSSLDNRHNKSRVVDPAHDWSPFQTPGFDDLILYQCHVGSFSGYRDGHVAPGEVANFQQLQTKLSYIRGLGFNAIQLLPVQEFRADRSWGYNPAFFFALESAYGRPEELRSLVDACHRMGLAVFFDVVYNHISDDDSSFYHFDERADGTGDSYLSSFRTDWGMAPAFWQSGIREFFLSNMDMYFREYRADGLRFDSTRTLEAARGWGNDGWQAMQFLTWHGKQDYPGKYLIAEHIGDHESILSSAGFHSTWSNEPFDRALRALSGSDVIMNLEALVGNDFGAGRNYAYSWNVIKYLLGSHDECGSMRSGSDGKQYFVQRFGGRGNWYARAKARMAWGLNVTAKGTPMMFMGNECHLEGYWHDGQDSNGEHRFDWSIAGDGIGMGMRYFVQAANAARWAHPALRSGHLQVTHRDPSGVFAFKRYNESGDVLLVIVNASDTTHDGARYGVRTEQPGQWDQVLCSQDAWFGGWDGAGNAFYRPWAQADGMIYVNVPQWSVTIFRLL